jgi:hypothetical protein
MLLSEAEPCSTKLVSGQALNFYNKIRDKMIPLAARSC